MNIKELLEKMFALVQKPKKYKCTYCLAYSENKNGHDVCIQELK